MGIKPSEGGRPRHGCFCYWFLFLLWSEVFYFFCLCCVIAVGLVACPCYPPHSLPRPPSAQAEYLSCGVMAVGGTEPTPLLQQLLQLPVSYFSINRSSDCNGDFFIWVLVGIIQHILLFLYCLSPISIILHWSIFLCLLSTVKAHFFQFCSPQFVAATQTGVF